MKAADRPVVKILHFTDEAENVRYWGLDKQGHVRSADVLSLYWEGKKVINAQGIAPGDKPRYASRRGKYHGTSDLRYPITKVEYV